MPIKQSFELFAGDDLDLQITVRNADDALYDLTNAAIAWKVAQTVNSAALISKSVGAGITISNQVTNKGEFVVTLTASDTTLTPRYYYHEADITPPGGKRSTVIYGQVLIKASLV